MPKLWKETVAEHRRGVRAAVLEAAWALAAERGVLGVTMGQVAERAGIGRATLYKYFSGVEAILVAAHTEHVDAHLARLDAARSRATTPDEALRRLLAGYAAVCFHRGRSAMPDMQGLVHAGPEHDHSRTRLLALFTEAVSDAQRAGAARADLRAEELAAYCVRALEAAGDLPSQAAVDRLVVVVGDALTPAM